MPHLHIAENRSEKKMGEVQHVFTENYLSLELVENFNLLKNKG